MTEGQFSYIGETLFQRYKVLDLLGTGKMGQVLSVWDIQTDQQRTLKLVDIRKKKIPLEVVIRFKAEAEILKSLNHPSVIRYRDFCSEKGLHGLVMEYQSLDSLESYLKKSGPIDISTALQLIFKLTEALVYIHGKGLIHFDLKPSNILFSIDEDSTISLKIVDFGFSRLNGMSDTPQGGTLTYMAPEQTGILKKNIDHRADLYSLGIILYECLTGVTPFVAKNPGVLIHQHIAKDPASIETHVKNFPAIFEKILMKLLRKDPEDRYRTTGGLLNDLKTYTQLSEQKETFHVTFSLGENDYSETFPRSFPFVGRESESDSLHSIINLVCDTAPMKEEDQKSPFSDFQSQQTELYEFGKANGGIVLLEGQKGIGKTKFLKKIYNELQHQAGLSIFYRIRKKEYPLPYETIRNLFSQLLQPLYNLSIEQREDILGALLSQFEHNFHFLLDLVPELKPWFDKKYHGEHRYKDDSPTKYQEVIFEFFKLVAQRNQRLILFFDDLQNLEESSLQALFKCLKSIRKLPVLFVFSYIHDELSNVQRSCINQNIMLSNLHHMPLPAMGKHSFAELIQKIFSNKLYEFPILLDQLHDAARGNPSLLKTLLLRLSDQQLIYFQDKDWHCSLNEVSRVIRDFSEKLAESTQLEDWKPIEKSVLQRGAIFQRAFALDSIKQLIMVTPKLKLSDSELLKILDKAVHSNILSVSDSMEYLFRDQSVRHALLIDIKIPLLQKLSRVSADYLIENQLSENPDVIYDIAHHMGHSDDQRLAMDYYEKSAQLTGNENFDDRQAEIYYNKALFCLKSLPLASVEPEAQFNIRYNAIMHTLTFTKGYDKLWTEMVELEPWIQGDKIREMKYLRVKSLLCFHRGQIKEMVQHAKEMISLGSNPEDDPHILHACILLGDMDTGKTYAQRIEYMKKGVEIAIRIRKFNLVVKSTIKIIVFSGYMGKFAETEQFIQETHKRLKSTNFYEIEIFHRCFMMIQETMRGSYDKVLGHCEKLRSSSSLFMDELREVFDVLYAFSLGCSGRIKESLSLFEELLQKERSARQGHSFIPVYHRRIELALKMDEPETALNFFEQSKNIRKRFVTAHTEATFFIFAADAYIRLDELIEASLVLKQTKKLVERLNSPVLECHFQFREAKLNWFQTSEKRYYDEVYKILDRLSEMGATGFYEQYQEEFHSWFRPFQKPVNSTFSFQNSANMFKLFEINRKITSTFDIDELFETALEGAMQIVGARQGYLFTYKASEKKEQKKKLKFPQLRLARNSSGDAISPEKFAFSRTIIHEIIKNRETIVTRDACNEKRWENNQSIFESELRSILAVPILLQGRVKGLIYLDNRHASSVFSIHDKEIVNVFATQVAIALNNAENHAKQVRISRENERLYQELNKHNQTLEQKVQERTAELQEKSKQLQDLNANLEQKVSEQLKARLKQDQMLLHQSKMAAMGEMIGMIAHQWRQPLSSISTVTANMQVFIDLDMLNKEDFSRMLTTVNDQIQFLSHTISDFRNFFSPKKKAEMIVLNTVMERTLKLIGKSLESRGIRLEQELSFKTAIYTFTNEMIQVLLNVLKNAQDIIQEKGICDGLIQIKGWESEEYQFIEVIDNGGGVPEEIMDKIFEPYFSTKDEKTGTGLGLYMSKTIIEKHCKGDLSVRNTEDGACFQIKLQQNVNEVRQIRKLIRDNQQVESKPINSTVETPSDTF